MQYTNIAILLPSLTLHYIHDCIGAMMMASGMIPKQDKKMKRQASSTKVLQGEASSRKSTSQILKCSLRM